MAEKLIFVSCGQLTPEEKDLGKSVKDLVDSKPGYKAYFAEKVQNLDGLAKNIFDKLQKCSGLISFLHERGLVTTNDKKKWGHRSSVWVNQEIAILAYRQQFEKIDEIPILVFKDKRVRLEGAMTSLIVNPSPMGSKSEILKHIESWLDSTIFPLHSSAKEERFLSKWNKTSDTSRKVISALVDEGGTNVKEEAIKKCLQESYKMGAEDANQAIFKARLDFSGHIDLVKLIHDIHSGDEMSINPTWEPYINQELNKLHC
jgi:hypothetical protein